MNFEQFSLYNSLLDANTPRLVEGPTGIGKTSYIKQMAEAAGADFIHISIPEYEVSDLVGMPVITGDRVGFTKPFWWPSNNLTYILLDEIDRGSLDVQPVIMGLCLSRTIGGRRLPSDVVIFAARNGEKYMTYPLDQAVMNRFGVVKLKPTVDEWVTWAEQNQLNKSVVNYIREVPEALDTPMSMIGAANTSCPSRRSWAMFATFMDNAESHTLQDDFLYEACESFIGRAAAAQFVSRYKSGYRIPSIKEIFYKARSPEKYTTTQMLWSIDKAVKFLVEQDATLLKPAIDFYSDSGDTVLASFIAALPSSFVDELSSFPKVTHLLNKLSNE